MELIPVLARETSTAVEASGLLSPDDDVRVQSQLSVTSFSLVVESRPVKVGQRVRSGELLARLSCPHLEVREAQERSMLHLLEAQLADARKAGGALQVKAAEERVEQSRSSLLSMDRLRHSCEVRSPIDGVVAELPPLTGAGGSVTVARVLALDPLRLELPVPLGDALPAPGATVDLEIGPLRASATVVAWSPVADPLGRVGLQLVVPNPGGRLPAGLTARACVEVGSRRGLFVPAIAIVDGAVLLPGGRERRRIERIATEGEEVEVLGLTEGQLIVPDAALRFV